MSENVITRVGDGQAIVTLDRPPLNIVTTEMLRRIASALDNLGGRSEVRLVRLEAAGRLFSAGVDVDDHIGDRLEPMMEALVELFKAFERLPVPSVAVVHGSALGGGMELTLATDLCIAAAGAKFGQPEIKLGVFAPPASVLLPRIVGERRALGLLLRGDSVTADEALRIGLVNAVFPDDRFREAADGWCGDLLELSGIALRHALEAVRIARDRPSSDAHRELLRLYLDRLMKTDDAGEGLRAFIEKRPPEWTHR